jgi:hypothetical protein
VIRMLLAAADGQDAEVAELHSVGAQRELDGAVRLVHALERAESILRSRTGA